MSDLALNWTALAVTVVLFAGLAWLHRGRHLNFSIRVIVATALGIAIGVVFKDHVSYVAAFGDVWANAIKAIVVPLLVFSVIASITGLGQSVRLKGIGVKTVVFLLVNTLTAAVLALLLAELFQVGRGFDWTPTKTATRDVPGVLDTLEGLFPSNFVGNWSENQVVPVILFALLVAIAVNKASATDRGRKAVAPFVDLANAGNVVFSKATQIVVGFTPYATLALIAAAVSNSDVAALLPLLAVLGVAYIALAIQLFVVQPLILAAAAHVNPLYFFKAYGPAGVVAFTSESSIGTIPVTVRQLRSSGVPEDIASFAATLGANLGMPGCAGVWPVLLAVFAINSQGLDYSIGQYVLLVVLALLVSIGTVGVPGTATVTATALFASAGLPVAFIAVAQPISQIVDMGRTAVNVAGAANTAYIVAATEKRLDDDLYYGRKKWDDSEEGAEAVSAGSSPVAVDAAPAVVAPSEVSDSSSAVPRAIPRALSLHTANEALEGTGGEVCGIDAHRSSDAGRLDAGKK